MGKSMVITTVSQDGSGLCSGIPVGLGGKFRPTLDLGFVKVGVGGLGRA